MLQSTRFKLFAVWVLVLVPSLNGFVPSGQQVTRVGSSTFKDDASTATSHGQVSSKASLLASPLFSSQSVAETQPSSMHPLKASLTKTGMMAYVASMCVALPATLLPIAALHKAKVISKTRKEKISLRTSQFCSRWLMRLIPFAKLEVIKDQEGGDNDEAAIWVCNHTSMLDIFVLLAADKKLRGKKKRPIKIIYWKDLEKNFVTGLCFRMCGFFPVEMADNGNGQANEYKKSSFKSLLRGIKEAFDEGFDIGILPEGQLNPSPEKGLQPVFPGAFTLAKMSKRPIRFMGLHGLHNLWHGDENIGMKVTGRDVKVRAYPFGKTFSNADDFVKSFESVIGYFGANGQDHPEWMNFLRNEEKQKSA
jgi:1-acyl-sn-glycerol-3-phosphate acyltransferase